MTAAEFGYCSMRLGIGAGQTEAMALYESCGYGPVPAYGQYKGNGISVCFEKPLNVCD